MNERRNKKQSAKAQPQEKPVEQKKPFQATPAAPEPERTATAVPPVGTQLSTEELRNAIFWSEIIAKPKYLESRERRRARLNAEPTDEASGE